MNTVFFPEIWDALRAAAEADLTLAQAIVDSAGVIIQSADLTICYDERGATLSLHFSFLFLFIGFVPFSFHQAYSISIAGAKYELPKYVLSEPTNLIRDS